MPLPSHLRWAPHTTGVHALRLPLSRKAPEPTGGQCLYKARRKGLRMAFWSWEICLTCINEDSIHIDFGTERAQDKSTGWSEHQHCEQDSWKRDETKIRFKKTEVIQWAQVKGQEDCYTSIPWDAWLYTWHYRNQSENPGGGELVFLISGNSPEALCTTQEFHSIRQVTLKYLWAPSVPTFRGL